jgi:hypothetical protein
LYVESIIENPNNWDLRIFEEWFRTQLIDGTYFIPNDFGLIKPQFPIYYPEFDHDWCELICLREE